MVVTCGNGNFKLPHPNFCEIFFFSALWRKFLFSEKFLQDFAHDKIFLFSAQNFSFLSLFVIVLYILFALAETLGKSKTFSAKFSRIFCVFLSRGGI